MNNFNLIKDFKIYSLVCCYKRFILVHAIKSTLYSSPDLYVALYHSDFKLKCLCVTNVLSLLRFAEERIEKLARELKDANELLEAARKKGEASYCTDM